MKQCYQPKRFNAATRGLLDTANAICDEYVAQGLTLTLRQLYYQLVARGVIENQFQQYKKLQRILSEARLAGVVDWDSIEDRTRFLRTHNFWNSPQSILNSAAYGFRLDTWASQDTYVEVWVEKDALVGVVERACERLRLPYFSCRGYASQSEVHEAAMRFRRLRKPVTVLHLGDHDPSGVDMTRDIEDRMRLFGVEDFEIDRLALNMDQVREVNPPPNPVKDTDVRTNGYAERFGVECWELDALEPSYIVRLIEEAAEERIDQERWDDVLEREKRDRATLDAFAENYEDIAAWLEERAEDSDEEG